METTIPRTNLRHRLVALSAVLAFLPLQPASPANSLASMVGTWRVHGETVVIRADGTGTDDWNLGPCHRDRLCVANATLRLTEVAGGVKATYATITVKDNTGSPAADVAPGRERVGKSYLISYVRPGLLQRRALDGLEPFGNPYLCGEGVSAADAQKC